MNTVVLLSIILGSALYVALPFLRKKTVSLSVTGSKNVRLDDLYTYRDNLVSSIKELEFDCETGKIGGEDFAEINARYRRQAIGVLKDIHSLEKGDGSPQKFEKELSDLRLKGKSGGTFDCPHCEAPVMSEDSFCSQCGHRLHNDGS